MNAKSSVNEKPEYFFNSILTASKLALKLKSRRR